MLLPRPVLPDAAEEAPVVLWGVVEDGRVDLWEELPGEGLAVGFGDGASGVEARLLAICWRLYSGVGMGCAAKLLAAMVAAAWTDLSVRSAGRGSECASLGKLRRAPVPRSARAAANWHVTHTHE